MVVSRHQNAGQNHNINVANKLYENVAKSNAWEQHIHINCIQEIIKNRQIRGMTATIWSIIFCLPVSWVKDWNKEKQKFAVVLHGFWNSSLTLRKVDSGCSVTGWWESKLGLRRRKYQEAGKYYIMRSFTTGILQQILFVGSNQVGWDGREIWQVRKKNKRVRSFVGETLKNCLEDLVNFAEWY